MKDAEEDEVLEDDDFDDVSTQASVRADRVVEARGDVGPFRINLWLFRKDPGLNFWNRPKLQFQLLDYYERQSMAKSEEYDPAFEIRAERSLVPKVDGFEHVEDSDRNHTMYLFGRTSEGFSVCLAAKVYPVLVVRLHKGDEKALVAYLRSVRRIRLGAMDMFCETFFAHDAGGFHPDFASSVPSFAAFPFIRIAFRTQMQLWSVRSLLMKHNEHYNPPHVMQKFTLGPHIVHDGALCVEVVETKIPNVLQLLQQSGLTPSGHVEIDVAHLVVNSSAKVSHCDLEASCVIPPFGTRSPLRGVSLDTPEGSRMNPLVVLSFDIESISPSGAFPNPNNPADKIVSICNTTKNFGTGEIVQSVHGLGRYVGFPASENVQSFTYASEKDLLNGWRHELVHVLDPDMITGYNIDGFDWEYMNTRAHLLQAWNFFFFGRLASVECDFQDTKFQSKAHGAKKEMRFQPSGRIGMDLYTYMMRNFSLDSYTLSAVSKRFLKDNDKDDLPIKLMMQYAMSGNPELNFLVMKYCLKDTRLPILIFDTLRILFLQVEMSRVCSVFMSDLFRRGQMLKVMSQFYIFAREHQFVLTNMASFRTETYQGATVLSCEAGFFDDVVVLDFASLYPSIMIAYNQCYSSWLAPGTEKHPGFVFEKFETDLGTFEFQQTLPGLLPQLLRKLLNARKVAKRDMNAAEAAGDEDTMQLMNGRQLALKVSCNSVYGFTGASEFGLYPCPPIAASVTSKGRYLIAQTIQHVERDFDAKVIYGDTDSVFVVPGKTDPETRMRFLFALGVRMAKEISAKYPPDINLEFEKVYLQFLLLSKKTYIGMKYTSLGSDGKVEAKGFALVRRDFCPWVRETLQLVVDLVVKYRDVRGAVQMLADNLALLVSGQVEYSKLVLSRKLAASYKQPNNSQHCVAQKMEARAPGYGPKSGDRVFFVVLDNGCKKMYEKVEDFVFARDNKLALDLAHYIKCIKAPIIKMFCVFPDDIKQRVQDVFVHFDGDAFRKGDQDLSVFFSGARAQNLSVFGEDSTIRHNSSMFQKRKVLHVADPVIATFLTGNAAPQAKKPAKKRNKKVTQATGTLAGFLKPVQHRELSVLL